jgi:hypothetical protein
MNKSNKGIVGLQNWQSYALRGIMSFVFAYVFGSIAIDTGRWLFYFLTGIAAVFGLRQLYLAVRERVKA